MPEAMSEAMSEATPEAIPGLLGDISPQVFFSQYWQRQPLLLRGTVADAPLQAIDRQWLFSAAAETELESRLVRGPDANGQYQVEYGPPLNAPGGADADLPWTLLVRDVDKICPEADSLLNEFAMMGRWRMEDVMVSLAVNGGSVGPHSDQYDVFLVQAKGQRRWQIDTGPNPDLSVQAGQELALLQQFCPNQDLLLQPGDCLYLPPGVPHHGTAAGVDDCITWSVGLRTPAAAELWMGFAEHQMNAPGDSERLRDPYRRADPSGPIARQDLDQVRQMLGGLNSTSETELVSWFGCHITAPGSLWEAAPLEPTAINQVIDQSGPWKRQPGALLAWYAEPNACWLFANGKAYLTDQASAQTLSGCQRLSQQQWTSLSNQGNGSLLQELVEAGVFAPESQQGQ